MRKFLSSLLIHQRQKNELDEAKIILLKQKQIQKRIPFTRRASRMPRVCVPLIWCAVTKTKDSAFARYKNANYSLCIWACGECACVTLCCDFRAQSTAKYFSFSFSSFILIPRYAPTKWNTFNECANSKLLIVNFLNFCVPWVALALPRNFVMQILDVITLRRLKAIRFASVFRK